MNISGQASEMFDPKNVILRQPIVGSNISFSRLLLAVLATELTHLKLNQNYNYTV